MAVPAQAAPLSSASVLGEAVKTSQSAEQPMVIPYLSHGMTAADVEPIVIPYLSHGLTAADVAPAVIPDAVDRAVANHTPSVDPVTGIPLSAGIPHPGDPYIVTAEPRTYTIEPGRSWYLVTDPVPARPDDRGDRFVVGDGTPAPTLADDGFALDWENGVTVGLGGLAIVLALVLAMSYLRRPRIAL